MGILFVNGLGLFRLRIKSLHHGIMLTCEVLDIDSISEIGLFG